MKKVTQNGTVASHERYLYRGYLQIAALDMLDNRNVLRTLLWDPLEPVATRPLALVQGASLYCYGVDFNKNVSEVFDAQGTIAAAYDYSPYGAVTGTGSLVQPVQWSGEMHDEEPALVYYNYRYYNPKDGRWINRDPIAEQGGQRSSTHRERSRQLTITPPMEQPPAPEDSSSPSSGPARCTTKNPSWPITITAFTTQKTEDGSTATPSLNGEDGIFMRS
ncbi:hypothetical protein CXT86_08110 [Akkermansia muciniphila]|nr:hypothetical protein CXT86_08110 [Akkermansia muciniphila]